MIKLLKGLRHRKVWLFAGTYLAIAWVLLEVAATLESTLELPNWVDQTVLVLLALGFPIALLMTWTLESHSEREAQNQAESSAAKPVDSSGPPSLAVMPFENLSDSAERDYFADGMTEDLITALSRFPWLFVISRGTCFSYKGLSARASQVAAELGVSYIIEGRVRMTSSRLRITVQLVDAVNDRHIWAENYDRDTGDLFELQDEISQAITGVLIPALSAAERERYQRVNHPTLDAWSSYQQALMHYYRPYSNENHAQSRELLDQSIQLDPNFADAHAMIAMMGVYSIVSGQTSYTSSRSEILSEARTAAEQAVQLDDRNALAHVALGRVHQLLGQHRVAISEGRKAIELNPNLAIAHHELGFILYISGQLENSIDCFDKAIKLSPNDPSRWNFFLLKGLSLLCISEFERAIDSFEESSQLRPTAFWPFIGLASAYAAQDKMERAVAAREAALTRNPEWSQAKMKGLVGDVPHLQPLLNYSGEAGFPEN